MDSPAVIALKEARCALCGRDDATLVMRGPDWLHQRGGEFTVVRCRHCGLVYQNPQPTSDSMAFLYPADYAPHDVPREAQPSRSLFRRTIRALLDNRYGYAARPSSVLRSLLLPF